MRRYRVFMSKVYLVVIVATLLFIVNPVLAEVIIATETARGEWENGTFTPYKPEFRFRFEIDEEGGKARLTELVRLKNESVVHQPVDYVIAAKEERNGIASFFISEKRRNQRIITLVGKPGALAMELVLLGEDFFEYCKATSGRLYLSTGTAKRAVSVGDDMANQLKEAIEKEAGEKQRRR